MLGGARWVAADKLHVTLLFLGGVEPEAVKDISGEMGRLAAGMARWSSRVRGLGAFPTPRRPRVLWAGVEGRRECFEELYSGLERRLAPFREKKEKRAYTPHITLARFKGRTAGSLEEVVQSFAGTDWGELKVDELTLFESRLSPKGAEYIPLFTADFKTEK